MISHYSISPVFSEVGVHQLVRGSYDCLRSNAGNSSGPPEKVWEIDLITYMPSLVILMCVSVLHICRLSSYLCVTVYLVMYYDNHIFADDHPKKFLDT